MLSFPEAVIPKPKAVDTAVLNFNMIQKGFLKLSSTEKEFLYWVNYSRKNPKLFFDSVVTPIVKIYPQLKSDNLTTLKTTLYASRTLSMFNLNSNLTSMALAQARDITEHNAMPSHNSTTGKSFGDRFKENNLKKCGAENISYGQNEPVFLIVLLYLDLNISDLGHRKNLLNPLFTETGIGASSFTNGGIFIVEDFACDQE